MAFLLSLPSLKKMASVQLCGSLWTTEEPIRDIIAPEDLDHEWEDVDERIAEIEIKIIKNLSLLGLPDNLEKELHPVVQEMGRNIFHFKYGYGAFCMPGDQDFYFRFLSQVRFSNRGDVDTYATTKRHLREDGAMRQGDEAGSLFSWVTLVGHRDEIKSVLSWYRTELYASLKGDYDGCDRFWMLYVGDNPPALEASNTAAIPTCLNVFDSQINYGFRQGIDFAFSLLSKSEKLSHIKLVTTDKFKARTSHPISPLGWAHLILQLDKSKERETFYREYGYALLVHIVRNWTHHDLFKAAVDEIVNFLSVEQFGVVALDLACCVSKSVRPYDKTIGAMFVFLWQSAPQKIRSQYIQGDENDLPLLLDFLSKEVMANVHPRCFALVVGDVERLNILRSFLMADGGLTLCGYLIKGRCFQCLRLFRGHVSIGSMANKLEKVMKKTGIDVFELYHWIHGDY